MKTAHAAIAGVAAISLIAGGCSSNDGDAPSDVAAESNPETSDSPDDGNGTVDGG